MCLSYTRVDLMCQILLLESVMDIIHELELGNIDTIDSNQRNVRNINWKNKHTLLFTKGNKTRFLTPPSKSFCGKSKENTNFRSSHKQTHYHPNLIHLGQRPRLELARAGDWGREACGDLNLPLSFSPSLPWDNLAFLFTIKVSVSTCQHQEGSGLGNNQVVKAQQGESETTGNVSKGLENEGQVGLTSFYLPQSPACRLYSKTSPQAASPPRLR